MSELTKEKLFNFIDSAKALGLKTVSLDFNSHVQFFMDLSSYVSLKYSTGNIVYGKTKNKLRVFDIGGLQIVFE